MIAEELRLHLRTLIEGENVPLDAQEAAQRSLQFIEIVDRGLTKCEGYLRANTDLDAEAALVHHDAVKTLASYLQPIADFERGDE